MERDLLDWKCNYVDASTYISCPLSVGAQTRDVTVIHIIRFRATQQQIEEMLQTLGAYIKLAVDIQRGVLAGGGVMHADCESALLDDGSRQENVWGADWKSSMRLFENA